LCLDETIYLEQRKLLAHYTTIHGHSKTMCRLSILLCIILGSLPSTCFALTGKVISVADGDTITVLDSSNQTHKIRLYGIDCPEKRQAYGKAAKKHTSQLTYRKIANVKEYDTDRYGRTVGVVTVDGVNVNESLIDNGYAWQYRKYCKASFCNDWLALEADAQMAQVGLWKDSNAQAPWEWRKDRRTVQNHDADKVIGRYHGNVNSKVLHGPGCKHYNCQNCTVGFNSVADAEKQGYKVHKSCVD
jgi:endonuclease YncB( thermonuclease family)